MTPPTSLTVTRTISCTPEAAYDSWTIPEQMLTWSPPSEGSTMEFDVRVGGKYLMNVVYEGGEIPHRGEYKVLDRPKKVQQTWTSPPTHNQETMVTIVFKAVGDKTEVALTHEQLPEDAVEPHRQGWEGVLEMMATWLESRSD